MLEKRQAQEEKKVRLQQEESRLNLEAEIAKTSAKEKALGTLATPSLSQLKPVKLESRFDDNNNNNNNNNNESFFDQTIKTHILCYNIKLISKNKSIRKYIHESGSPY